MPPTRRLGCNCRRAETINERPCVCGCLHAPARLIPGAPLYDAIVTCSRAHTHTYHTHTHVEHCSQGGDGGDEVVGAHSGKFPRAFVRTLARNC